MAKIRKKGSMMKILLIVIGFVLLLLLLVGLFIWKKLDMITYADEVPAYSMEATEALLDESVSDVISNSEPVSEDYVVELDPSLETVETPEIPDTDVAVDDHVMNILLIGTDERTAQYNTNARADSMILVSINKDLHTVRLVSLERGIGVPILEGELEGQYDLLTHVFRWGGADLLIKTVEHCFKVDVNHYVRVNFAAVEKIVDAIGGIELEFTSREAHGLNEWAAEHEKQVKSGVNRVDGNTALRFARLRWIDSDWQRVGRQRKVILAVVNELKSADLTKLNQLADTVLPLIQTNLTKLEIAELMLYSPNFLRSQFDQMTIPKQGTYGGMGIRNGGGAFAVNYEINNDLLYRFLYEGATSEELLAEGYKSSLPIG